ncbi:lactosylceramide 4-alpha-galactosyltransferase-like [Pectinophora gossypiella]|uniref:lactosylceramide 4-alpha-galactosyltransferase-like n=1 Tax=Pectinophora gossypiella TaxID=13191 RepID=UPI00214F32F9|nr:lactosylceramide 4-alpha-galactosyltransferase-like [Pectinophora gossypiella]
MNEKKINETSKNIFLIETSCKGYLDLRQLCAVKSAARAHPDWQINLLFVGPVTHEKLTTGILSSLQAYENVVIARVYLSQIVKDTPLERVLTENLLETSEYRYAHVSDIIRLLLLWKFGGVYMDLDIVVLKPFDDLGPDFAGLDAPNSVNTAVMGFKVYSEETFYPISAQHWREYFQPGVFNVKRFSKSHTVHVLNSLSHVIKDRTIKPWTLYANMAKMFCPPIYSVNPESLSEQ